MRVLSGNLPAIAAGRRVRSICYSPRRLNGSLTTPEASVYESFYGLAQSPFSLAPDPRFLYLSESHQAAIRRILQALRRRESFIVLSGDIGTGKTTLCRALLEQLDRTAFSCLIMNPFVSIDELLRQMLVDYGVVSRDALKSDRFRQAATNDLVNTLSDFLVTLAPLRGSAVVIIDEAQHLKPAVLEELRVIAGLHSDARLLQIVLVGQPSLLEVLSAENLRQLDQRISLKAMLQPLDREDVEHYVAHRLTVAGESVSVVFEKAAIKRLHAVSGGVPRVINLLCDRALMAGAERGVHEITPAMVDQAADAISFRRPPAEGDRPVDAQRGRVRNATVAVLGVLAVVAVVMRLPVDRLVNAAPPALPPAPAPRVSEIPPLTIPPEEAEIEAALAEGRPTTVLTPPRLSSNYPEHP
jgi:general secretion pathway protein A